MSLIDDLVVGQKVKLCASGPVLVVLDCTIKDLSTDNESILVEVTGVSDVEYYGVQIFSKASSVMSSDSKIMLYRRHIANAWKTNGVVVLEQRER